MDNFWNTEIYGYLSMIFYSITFVPQIYKCYKSKEANSLSYLMLFISCLGTIFNLIYSILISAQPNIISAVLYLSATLSITGMKYYYSFASNVNNISNKP
jgi:MtN3 and saliva related transmembrane protein